MILGDALAPNLRKYEQTHKWLTFQLDANRIPPPVWILLGEARSKCEHLAGIPLRPKTADELQRIFLAKGVRATTAIEGNTLSEDQVRQKIEGTLKLPPSKEYLGQEIENVLEVFNQLMASVVAGHDHVLTVDGICAFNAQVLHRLAVDPEVQPGHIRTHSVGVMHYRGAPAEDCAYLLARLVDWLSDESFQADAETGVIKPILAAILAHLYLAWIHPFGDGNGRTARLVEFAILVSAGVPAPAAHLLSNHYNETRSEYYRQLDLASRSGGDVVPFIRYAVQGLVDGLRSQIDKVREQQIDVAWRNYVHETFRNHAAGDGVAKRRRELVLALSAGEWNEKGAPFGEISTLTPHLAKLYATLSERAVRRDLNELATMGLVEATKTGRWRARIEVIFAFLPARRTERPPTLTSGS
jgi:Fic family protein